MNIKDKPTPEQLYTIVQTSLNRRNLPTFDTDTYILTWSGLIPITNEDHGHLFTIENIEENLDHYHHALFILPFMITETSKKGLVNSYHLKHRLERLLRSPTRGPYLSNGELIMLMLYLGYRPITITSPNTTFNCKFIQ